jgi:hypothetical protein
MMTLANCRPPAEGADSKTVRVLTHGRTVQEPFRAAEHDPCRDPCNVVTCGENRRHAAIGQSGSYSFLFQGEGRGYLSRLDWPVPANCSWKCHMIVDGVWQAAHVASGTRSNSVHGQCCH